MSGGVHDRITETINNIESTFSIPSLFDSGIMVLFMIYLSILIIPLILGFLKLDASHYLSLIGLFFGRIVVSFVPIVGVFIALYIWWEDIYRTLNILDNNQD